MTWLSCYSDWCFVADALISERRCFNLGEKMLFMWATQSCFCIIIQHHCSNYWSSARGRLLCFSFYHTRCQVAVANHHIKGLELNLSSYPSSKTLTYVAGNKVMICRLFILLSTFFLFKSSLNHPFKKISWNAYCLSGQITALGISYCKNSISVKTILHATRR